MKNATAVFLTLLLAVSLTGCGAPAPTESSGNEPAVSEASSVPDIPVSAPAQEPAPAASPDSSAESSVPEVTNSAPPAAPGKPESKSEPAAPPAPAAAPPEGTGAAELYFTLNGSVLDTETLENISCGGGNHDSDGDGIKENIGFSMLIELMGKKPEQLADTGTIEFMDGTTVTKTVGDLVASVVVYKSDDASINDQWGDYNLRFRFICNDVPAPYVKSITWAEK